MPEMSQLSKPRVIPPRTSHLVCHFSYRPKVQRPLVLYAWGHGLAASMRPEPPCL